MESGIYKIENTKTGKVYIGGTSNLHERKINHFSMLRNNNHHCKSLQNDYNKHKDKSIFVFTILEYCNIIDLEVKEDFYLDKIGNSSDFLNGTSNIFKYKCYNTIAKGGKGWKGKHTQESINKFVENNPNRKEVHVFKNKKYFKKFNSCSEAASFFKLSKSCILNACSSKRYITKSKLCFCFDDDLKELSKVINSLEIVPFNKGKKMSKDEIYGSSLCTKIKCTNLNNGQYTVFYSQRDACEHYKLQPCTINRCVKLGKPYKKYLKIEYYNDIV